jgi:hypothetical protein
MPVAKVILDLITTKFGKNLKETEKKWKKWKKSIFSVKNALGVVFAGALARKVGQFGASAVDAYETQEHAVAKLADAMARAGDSSRGAMMDMKDFASEVQSITTLGDEAVLSIMALGSNMGDMTGKELKKATIAAIGLSKAYNISLEGAMRNMMKTMSGQVGELGEIIPALKEATSGQEMFNMALQIGTEKFSAATAEAETATGKLKQWKNLYGDIVKENLGRGIAEGFAEAGREIQKAITGAKEWNTEWNTWLALNVKEEILTLASGVTYITGALQGAAAVLSPLLWIKDAIWGEGAIAGIQERLTAAGEKFETAEALGRRARQAGQEAEYARFRAEHRGALKQVGDIVIANTKEEGARIKNLGRTAGR